MEEGEVIYLLEQYLSEKGFDETLKSLEKESGRLFMSSCLKYKTGALQDILDDYTHRRRMEKERAASVDHLFESGSGDYVSQEWTSLDYLTEGYNVLVVRLTDQGALAVGGSKAKLVTTTIPVPLPITTPPRSVISQTHEVCKGAVLTLDFHPTKSNLLLVGSMDRTTYIVDTECTDVPVMESFNDHTRYVVRALWSRTGDMFVTGSYDKTVCVYKYSSDDDCYKRIQVLQFKGAVEAMVVSKISDVCVVGIRNDNQLHCFDLSADPCPQETHVINMNTLGDDYVSFTPMHISFSPNERHVLVSTDKDKLMLYDWATGQLITSLYGATNDEYSQPRHCWDPSGLYVYGTSQDHIICVWEVRSQQIVAKLTGHKGIVRDLYFCTQLKVLVSCGYDGAIKLWMTSKDLLPPSS